MQRTTAYRVLTAAGLVTALALPWMPLQASLRHFIIEDSFYYLTAARNLVHGAGPTLDGVHPTNGFHPLWFLIVSALTLVTGWDRVLTLRLALTLSAVFFDLSVLMFYLTLRRSSTAAAPAAALLAFNYRLMSIPLGGLETGLAGSLALLVVCLDSLQGPVGTLRQAVLRGILFGLASLARFDLLLLAVCALCWNLIRPDSLVSAGKRLRLTAAAATVVVICLVPWFVFSWRATGTLLPQSGEAIRALYGSPWVQPASLLAKAHIATSLLAVAASDLCNILGLYPVVHPRDFPLWTEFVLGALVILMVAAAWRCRHSPRVAPLLWVPIWAALHVLYYLYFGIVRIRYLYPLIFPLAFFAVISGSEYIQNRRSRIRLTLLPPLLLGVSTWAGVSAFRQCVGDYIFHGIEPGFYVTARWLSGNTPKDAVVGAFNAGIISYFSDRRTVNLDGCMNESVIQPLRDGQLARYIKEARIAYLADSAPEIDRFMNTAAGRLGWRAAYQEVFSVPAPYFGGRGYTRLTVLQRSVEPPK